MKPHTSAPPMRYNGPENRPTSISFVLAEASAPWYSWSGYELERTTP